MHNYFEYFTFQVCGVKEHSIKQDLKGVSKYLLSLSFYDSKYLTVLRIFCTDLPIETMTLQQELAVTFVNKNMWA